MKDLKSTLIRTHVPSILELVQEVKSVQPRATVKELLFLKAKASKQRIAQSTAKPESSQG